MTTDQPSAAHDRRETPTERLDRHWSELLQELRVAQTGVQILTGFLLTVPFQQRFADLDGYQRTVYLVLVVLAITATAFIVAPVSVHRLLYRRHLRRELVADADRLARLGLFTLALVLTGSALLLFDITLGRTAGIVAGATIAVLLLVMWVLMPLRLVRRAPSEHDPATE